MTEDETVGHTVGTLQSQRPLDPGLAPPAVARLWFPWSEAVLLGDRVGGEASLSPGMGAPNKPPASAPCSSAQSAGPRAPPARYPGLA